MAQSPILSEETYFKEYDPQVTRVINDVGVLREFLTWTVLAVARDLFTLAGILFHDPTAGRVLVDGYDLRQVTQHSLCSQMGIVLQDPFLFSGTIAENLRFSRPEASEAEMQAAAQAVGLSDFISQLPHGYDTPLEEGGVLLSVGQRQLISFARALLADPRILILDEATSSVDTQTEIAIQKALARPMQTRTSFVIAHRLSTVVNADRILVIEGGLIVEQGSHRQLLEKRGVYYRLYQSGFED
jgi:ATP-binding cassette subfamily B multidrug efflux pump